MRTEHRVVCGKCGARTFQIHTDNDAINTHSDISNLIGDYYGITLQCQKCGNRHEVGLGSD